MPTTMITDSCPAPEFNLTQRDVEQCVPELEAYLKEFASAFGRIEQFRQSQVYLKGLLSNLLRKTTERIALELGENVRDLQHFVGQSPWGTEPLVATHQRLVGELLGEEDGVALIDESGVVKQGGHTLVFPLLSIRGADRRVGGGQTGRGFGRRWAAILRRGG